MTAGTAAGGRGRAPTGAPLDYAFSLDGGRPASRPAQRLAAARRARAEPHLRRGGVHLERRRAGAAPATAAASLGGVVYELHVGTFTPEGTLDAAIGHLEHLVELGVDVVEVMPVAAFGGTHGWGYDGVAPYAVARRLRRPGRASSASSTRATHAASASASTSSTTTSARRATTSPSSGPTSPTPTPRRGGRPSTSTPTAATRCAAGSSTTPCAGSATSTSTRCVWTPCTSCATTSEPHLLAQLSDETASLATELGRPLDLIAESDLNDAVMVTPTGEGGRGMTAQWDDDIHHALHVALTGETQGYYADFAGGTEAWPEGGPISVLAKTLTDAFLHDGRMSTFRGRVWGAPRRPRGAVGARSSSPTSRPTTRSATAPPATASATRSRRASRPSGPRSTSSRPSRPMVFMGEEWRASTPFAFFTSFEEELARGGRPHRAACRVRRPRLGRGRRARPAGPRHPRPQRARLERAERARAQRDAALLPRADPDPPDPAGRRVRRPPRRRRCAFDEDAQWIIMSRGSVHVVANLAGRAQVVPFDGEVEHVLASWGRAPIVDSHGVGLDGHDVAVLRTTA